MDFDTEQQKLKQNRLRFEAKSANYIKGADVQIDAENGSEKGNPALDVKTQDELFHERLLSLEGRIDSLIMSVEGLARIQEQLKRDIAAIKAGLGALGKHVHLPNGDLGLPLKIKI